MKIHVAVLLCLIATVAGLIFRQPRDGIPCIAPSCAASTEGTHAVQESAVATLKSVGKVSRCSGSACQLNATRTTAGKLVWVIGSSIDRNAVTDTCNNIKAAVIDLDPTIPNHIFWCVLNPSTTLVFTFSPGATPGPYYDAYYAGYGNIAARTDMLTTTDMLTSRAALITHTFGKPPDSAVLDSSMWDIANWWQKSGRPQDWPVPHAEIANWCQATIPNFLTFMQALLPNTRIAYHSPPPAFATHWKPWTVRIDQTVNEMYSCLVSKMNSGLLYGKYPFIDFFKIVQAQQLASGGQMRALYKDDLHPGSMLSLVFMAEVLKWA